MPQGSCASTHDGRHERVDLCKGGVLYVQAVARDAVQRRVVQHHDAVRALCQPLQGQKGVVRLNYDVTGIVHYNDDIIPYNNNEHNYVTGNQELNADEQPDKGYNRQNRVTIKAEYKYRHLNQPY